MSAYAGESAAGHLRRRGNAVDALSSPEDFSADDPSNVEWVDEPAEWEKRNGQLLSAHKTRAAELRNRRGRPRDAVLLGTWWSLSPLLFLGCLFLSTLPGIVHKPLNWSHYFTWIYHDVEELAREIYGE